MELPKATSRDSREAYTKENIFCIVYKNCVGNFREFYWGI